MATPPPARRTSRALVTAVVLVIAAAIVMWFVTRPPKPAAVAPPNNLLAGAGLLDGPDARFTWSRDPRADIYRLETYDLNSHLLAAAMLRDTSVLASAVLPESAKAGIWRVVPVSVGGTELPPTPNERFVRK